jgi:RNA polymerase sigma-70 factor (ECF subfamily)
MARERSPGSHFAWRGCLEKRVTSPDALLIAATLRGDQTAFERLIRRHFRAVYATALALTGLPADAEDVCQEALVTAYYRLADCRKRDRFGQWLLQIVRNRAHNYRRREALRATLPLHAHIEDARRAAPSQDLERAELREYLIEALNTLTGAQRAVVVLHDLEGFTHREIGEALDISELMARRHLSDARRKLRLVLARFGEAHTRVIHD